MAMFDSFYDQEVRWENYWAETPCPWDQTPHERRKYVYECPNCGHAIATIGSAAE